VDAPAVRAEVADPAAVYRRLLAYLGPYRLFAVVAVFGMALEAAAAGVFTWLMQPLVGSSPPCANS
jgi:hypothetical protein